MTIVPYIIVVLLLLKALNYLCLLKYVYFVFAYFLFSIAFVSSGGLSRKNSRENSGGDPGSK